MMSLRHRLLMLLAIGGLVAAAWLAPLDDAATTQIDTGLKRALASFATARLLNAAISVVQGTEVAVEPFGVGVTVAAGQVLDPINDLVEQFSALMLAASVSFGLQRLLVAIGGHWAVSLLLSALALGWAAARWRGDAAPGWLTRLLLVTLLARFAVPLVAVGSEAAFQLFLAAEYQSAQAGMNLSAQAADRSTPEAQADQGVVEKLKGWWSSKGDRFAALKQAAEQAVEHMLKLIAVFLLQTLLLPLALMWALLRVSQALSVRLAPRGADDRRELPAGP